VRSGRTRDGRSAALRAVVADQALRGRVLLSQRGLVSTWFIISKSTSFFNFGLPLNLSLTCSLSMTSLYYNDSNNCFHCSMIWLMSNRWAIFNAS
jgi:hypothetical protein